MIKYIYALLFIFLLSLSGYEVQAQRHGGMGKANYSGRARTTKKMKYGSRRVSMSGSRYGGGESDKYIGLSLGATNSLTDVGGKGFNSKPFIMDIQWKKTHWMPQLTFNHPIGDHFKMNYSILYAKLSGTDTLVETTSRYKRGFTFTNNIIELSAVLQFHLPKIEGSGGARYKGGGMSDFFSNLDFYVFAGIGGIYHSPELVNKGTVVINTDSVVKNFQPIIPMGLGASYAISEGVKIGISTGWRKTFTDYLDGFTREHSKGNDSYIYTSVNLQFKLPEGRGGSMRSFR